MGLFGPPNIEKLIEGVKAISAQHMLDYLVLRKKNPPSALLKIIKAGPRAVPALATMVEEAIAGANGAWAANATYALTKIPDRSVIPALLTVMKSDLSAAVVGRIDIRGAGTVALADPFEKIYEEIVSVISGFQDEAIPAAMRQIAMDRTKANSRPFAVRFISRLEDPKDIPLLLDVLEEDKEAGRPGFRSDVFRALMAHTSASDLRRVAERFQARGVPGLQEIVGALEDSDASVRLSAAKVLAHIGDSRTLPALVIVTQDEDEHVAREAQAALTKIAVPLARSVQKLWKDYRTAHWNFFSKKKHPGELDRIHEPQVRSVFLFLRCWDPEIGEEAYRAIRGFEIDVRELPAQFLARDARRLDYVKFADSSSRPYQDSKSDLGNRVILKVREPNHFEMVSQRLALLGGETSVDVLVEALGDFLLHNRGRAAGALGKIGDDRAVEPLLRMFANHRAEGLGMGSTIISALEKIGSKKALEALEFIARNPIAAVQGERGAAEDAIESVKKRLASSQIARSGRG